MYTKLKKIGLRFTPKWMRDRVEPIARSIIALRYKGNEFQCNLCKYKLNSFVLLDSEDLLCPRCGSLGRTRGLWALIQSEISGKRVLHFSPPKSLRKAIKLYGRTKAYTTSDYMGEFSADRQYNLCDIDKEENTVDIVICFHVLEHIVEDQQAMSELYRILTPGGKAYIQTPFKSGEIYEDQKIQSPLERKTHFGQEDHVRIYSPKGLRARLQLVGFDVEVISQNHGKHNFHGLKEEEIIIVATK